MANPDKLPNGMLLFIGLVTGLCVAVLFLAVELLYFKVDAELQNEGAKGGVARSEVRLLKKKQASSLTEYRWIDRDKKTVAIPIERAIELAVLEHKN